MIQLHQQAKQLLQARKLDETIGACQAVLSQESNEVTIYQILGSALQLKGRLPEASYWYRRSLELEPNCIEVCLLLGSLYEKQKSWTTAIDVYRNFIQTGSQSLEIYLRLGFALEQEECWDESMAYYTKAIQIEPEFDRIYYRMGEVWSAQNNWKQSISAYRKAIELNPDFPWSYVRLGNAFYQLKQIQKSINVYRKAIKIRPDFAITYHKLGTVLIQMRRWGEVISTYRKAVAQGLTLSAESQYNLGLAYSQKERWGKAVQAYIDAIELEPDSHFWFYRQNFWDVLSRQKKLERVADICTKAAQEKLDSVWCCTNLGKARTLQRRFEEAAQALSAGSYRRAIEIHPEWKAPQVELEKVGKPDFLIIGTQKGGTTSLYYYLCHHPQILPALTKEIEFWSRGAYQGIDWYLSHFLPTPIDQNIVTGEATPSNLDHRGAAESIFEFYPDIKIIVILRNPIDRAISHYHHWFRNSWESRSLEDAVQQQIKKLQSYPDRVWDQANGYIARSTYIHFLRKWMSIFPREQFLILKSEDFYNAPQKVLGETFRFLNLSQYIISEYRCYNSGTYSDTESSVVETLNSYFHPYNQELEDFLEMRFTWEVGV